MRTLVVIPTYNEAENVVEIIEAVRASVPEVDLLIVDDSSPDGTAKLAEEAGARLGQVSVLKRDGKSGLGQGLPGGIRMGARAGLRRVRGDGRRLLARPRGAPSLLVASERAEVVIGSRYVAGAAVPNWPLARLALSRGGNVYASLSWGSRSLTRGRIPGLPAPARCEDGLRLGRGGGLHVPDRDDVPGSPGGGDHRRGADHVRRPRARGTSKMSSAIVVEALALVTWWALRGARCAGGDHSQSKARSTDSSLTCVSASSSAGSESETIPAPAHTENAAPSTRMPRMPRNHSEEPSASTQPTGPA